jgi:CBS domain-containing protein
MKVKEIMTPAPTCGVPTSRLEEITELMVAHNCGAIPIVESLQSRTPVGIITDRDITCRTMAKGRDPMGMQAKDIMTARLVTVQPDAELEHCCQIMERNQVRRVLVVDRSGECVGMVSLADGALAAPKWEAAAVVKGVSEPGRRLAEFVAY